VPGLAGSTLPRTRTSGFDSSIATATRENVAALRRRPEGRATYCVASNPGGPTNLFKGLGRYGGRSRDWNPLVRGHSGDSGVLLRSSGCQLPESPAPKIRADKPLMSAIGQIADVRSAPAQRGVPLTSISAGPNSIESLLLHIFLTDSPSEALLTTTI
jgi:hypothetical protein